MDHPRLRSAGNVSIVNILRVGVIDILRLIAAACGDDGVVIVLGLSVVRVFDVTTIIVVVGVVVIIRYIIVRIIGGVVTIVPGIVVIIIIAFFHIAIAIVIIFAVFIIAVVIRIAIFLFLEVAGKVPNGHCVTFADRREL